MTIKDYFVENKRVSLTEEQLQEIRESNNQHIEKLKEIAENEGEIEEREQPFKLKFSDDSQEKQFFLSQNFRSIMSKTCTMLVEYEMGAEKENVQSEITINSADLFFTFINNF